MPTQNQTISKDGLSQEVLDYIEGLEGENVALAEALDVATDELTKAAASTTTDDEDDDLVKGLAPEIAEIVKGIVAPIQAENASLRETVDGERDIRLTVEQIEKAKSFGFGDSTELGSILKSVMQNCGTEVYDKLVKSFSAAGEQIRAGAIFTEVGSTQPGSVADLSKGQALREAAQDLVTKGQAKNMSDAMRTLTRTAPELFNAEGA